MKKRGRSVIRDTSYSNRRTRKGESDDPAISNPASCSNVSVCARIMDPRIVGAVLGREGGLEAANMRGVEPLRQLKFITRPEFSAWCDVHIAFPGKELCSQMAVVAESLGWLALQDRRGGATRSNWIPRRAERQVGLYFYVSALE